jgi:hypothetical protein
MAPTLAERNKQLALKAFDTLFNRHDYVPQRRCGHCGGIQERAADDRRPLPRARIGSGPSARAALDLGAARFDNLPA